MTSLGWYFISIRYLRNNIFNLIMIHFLCIGTRPNTSVLVSNPVPDFKDCGCGQVWRNTSVLVSNPVSAFKDFDPKLSYMAILTQNK